MDIREVVDDPEWQALRESMVGTWKITPVKNVKRLRGYLYGERKKVDLLRHRRVYNYLTGSGFRIGVIQHKAIDRLLADLRARKPMHGKKRKVDSRTGQTRSSNQKVSRRSEIRQ